MYKFPKTPKLVRMSLCIVSPLGHRNTTAALFKKISSISYVHYVSNYNLSEGGNNMAAERTVGSSTLAWVERTAAYSRCNMNMPGRTKILLNTDNIAVNNIL